jgi:hypothetical protein
MEKINNDLNEVIKKLPATPEFSLGGYMDGIPAEDQVKIQRSFYTFKWLWEAAGKLKINRAEIINNALLDAVTAHHSEIPQIEYDIQQLDKEVDALLAQKNAKIHYLIQLKEKQETAAQEQQLARISRDQAVVELMQFLDRFFRDMGAHHFKRLEELSGVPAREIKAFVIEKNYTPSETEIRNFFNL